MNLDWINVGDLWRSKTTYYWGQRSLKIGYNTFVLIAGLQMFVPARREGQRTVQIHIVTTINGQPHKGYTQFKSDGIKFRGFFERVCEAESLVP